MNNFPVKTVVVLFCVLQQQKLRVCPKCISVRVLTPRHDGGCRPTVPAFAFGKRSLHKRGKYSLVVAACCTPVLPSFMNIRRLVEVLERAKRVRRDAINLVPSFVSRTS
jgi:hypothetical protein